jgi:SAM-dependent methyltransferase
MGEPSALVADRVSADTCLSSDVTFDALYEQRFRALSTQHWTPVRIARRAATLLTLCGAKRILDVGSGVGKFCIVGALTTNAEFVGVERRGYLVEVARHAAFRCGAKRASFDHANIDAFSFEGFDGVYLFNPFYELIGNLIEPIDGSTERSAALHRHFVRRTTEQLARMAAPVAVVTYGGFGGPMPPQYKFAGDEVGEGDQLELWVKR